MALFREAGLVPALVKSGGASVPLDATIRSIAYIDPTHRPVGMVAESCACMPADLPRLVGEDLLPACVEGPASAPAVILVDPLLGANLPDREIVKDNDPRIALEDALAALALHQRA
jgi:hypothetical protein